jgi:hypothetical protein
VEHPVTPDKGYKRYQVGFLLLRWIEEEKKEKQQAGPVRLNLSVWFISYDTIFFSHNKSANSTFLPDFSANQTGLANTRAPKISMRQ